VKPRFFSLKEANALVPHLSREFARVMACRPEIAALTARLGGADVALACLNGEKPAPPGLEAEAARLAAVTEEIKQAAVRIGSMGCVVKDLDLGLVDFYGRVDGKAVFLCWQYGEATVGHYHGLDEGYANRVELKARPVAPLN
jgi:hypothetical protein